MLRIAVCDDEALHVNNIITALDRIKQSLNEEMIVDCFSSGRELLEQCAKMDQDDYSIIFWDIVMTKENGIDAANQLRESGWKETKFIFVSSYPEYWRELYPLDTIGFIDKPISYEAFEKVFMKTYDRIQQEKDKFLEYKKNKSVHYIRMRCIEMISIDNRTITLQAKNGDIIKFYGAISDIWNALKSRKDFVMPTQSNIINLDYVQSLSPDGLHLMNQNVIAISRLKKDETLRRYFNYIRKRGE